MRTITISDKTTTGVLGFDLRDLLQLLGSKAANMQWLVMKDVDCIGPRAEELRGLATRAVRVESRALAAIATGITQVVDGEFCGYEESRPAPTIILRAVDSSSWDISSDRDAILDIFRQHFRAVFEAGEVY